MANAPPPGEGGELDLRQVGYPIDNTTNIPQCHEAIRPSQNSPHSHKELNIDPLLNQRSDGLADASPSPMDDQSAANAAASSSSATANSRPAFSMPLNSPARSKRGSPSDVSNEDENEFRTFFHQKKKKGATRPTPRPQAPPDTMPTQPAINASQTQTGTSYPITTTHGSTTNGSTINIAAAQPSVWTASTSYALTRFPFPPIIVRFKPVQGKPCIKAILDELLNHYLLNHNVKIEIIHGRPSSAKCNSNELDFLLYTKDVFSFSELLDQAKWPLKLGNENFTFPSIPSIPPQLSLIVKNVEANIKLTDLAAELKLSHPSIRNVIRLKNKMGNDIHLVKLELTSPTERSKILEAKRITCNYVSYLVAEYLAPANVLICSKCCGLGHFRKQCTEAAETCRKCGLSCPDFKNHLCSTVICCKHCGGDHPANSMKCPVVRAFRADLTRKLLSKNTHHANSHEQTAIPPPLMAQPQTGRSPGYNPWVNNTSNRPPSQSPWSRTNSTDGSTLLKLDNLANGLVKIHDILNKVCESNSRLEAAIAEQFTRVQTIESEVTLLKEKTASSKPSWSLST